MLTALALDAQGNRSAAVDRLAAAFTTAPEPGAYARLFLAEGDPMQALLRARPARRGRRRAPGTRPGPHERPAPNHMLADPLSERETQVLRLLDSELTGPEIARALFVSHNTVRTHTRHIFAKLQVTTRRAAVLRADELRSAVGLAAPLGYLTLSVTSLDDAPSSRAAIRFGASRSTAGHAAHRSRPVRPATDPTWSSHVLPVSRHPVPRRGRQPAAAVPSCC